ncbi:MAG: hypothetical protein HY898_23475 [Deltaproteobacteria bacterium]|nr:hypothetical protein [Deltaproteobacteria bacterium]
MKLPPRNTATRALSRAVAPAAVLLASCSSLLSYDDVSFQDGGRPDASAGTGGTAGDAGWDGKAGGTGWGGGPQGGNAGKGGSAGAGNSSGSGGSVAGSGGSSQGGTDPGGAGGAPPTCTGIDCGANGKCVIDGGVAKCLCDAGYHPQGYTCVKDPSCDGVACSGNGTCIIYGGNPACQCNAGFHAQGLECVADTPSGACQTIDCGGHGTCLVDPINGPRCHCEVGYYLAFSQTNCVAATGTQCDNVSCGGFGTCWMNGMFPTCSCDPGYTTYGMYCVLEAKLGCRDIDNSWQPRGARRCSADNSHIEVCWDGNNDGLVEWIDGQVTCPNGWTCSECITKPCLAAGYPGKECPPGEECVPCPVGSHCVPEAHGVALYVCVSGCDCQNCANCEDPANMADWQEYCGNPNSQPATMACTIPCQAGEGCLPWGANSICWSMEGCFSAPP